MLLATEEAKKEEKGWEEKRREKWLEERGV